MMNRKFLSATVGVFICVLVVAGLFLVNSGKQAVAEEAPWKLRCDDIKKDGQPAGQYCEMFYKVVVKESGQTFMDFAIGVPQKGEAARGKVLLPLGILLTEPIRMQIDDQESMSFQVRYCDVVGCHAFLGLNEVVVDAFRGGENAVVSFVASNNQRLTLPVSLNGFSSAYRKVSQQLSCLAHSNM